MFLHNRIILRCCILFYFILFYFYFYFYIFFFFALFHSVNLSSSCSFYPQSDKAEADTGHAVFRISCRLNLFYIDSTKIASTHGSMEILKKTWFLVLTSCHRVTVLSIVVLWLYLFFFLVVNKQNKGVSKKKFKKKKKKGDVGEFLFLRFFFFKKCKKRKRGTTR